MFRVTHIVLSSAFFVLLTFYNQPKPVEGAVLNAAGQVVATVGGALTGAVSAVAKPITGGSEKNTTEAPTTTTTEAPTTTTAEPTTKKLPECQPSVERLTKLLNITKPTDEQKVLLNKVVETEKNGETLTKEEAKGLLEALKALL